MRTLRWVLVGVVAVLVSCGGGSSSTTSEASFTTSEASSTSTVTEIEVVYNVGDTGPGGGIIVYVDEAGFDFSGDDNESIGAICPTGTCHYLEMAPTDLEGQYSWDDAFAAAEAFSTPSANDWLLPSLDALNEMCKFAFGDTVNARCNGVVNGTLTCCDGGFSTVYYWSSSEYSKVSSLAWFQDFFDGWQGVTLTDYAYRVRPVRAF